MEHFKDLGSLSKVKGNRERPNFLLYNIKVLEIVGFLCTYNTILYIYYSIYIYTIIYIYMYIYVYI